jgi:hypothetical protein
MAKRAAVGFAVHTGWAAMVATDGDVLDRRRIVLMSGEDREHPRFVFHAASKLPFAAAERLVADSTELAYASALAELRAAIRGLQEHEVVACGIVTGGRPLTAPLEGILRSHALIHTAEGVLFREAVRRACEGLGIGAVQVPSRELRPRGAAALGVDEAKVDDHLVSVGRAAGRPWGKDQRDAFLAAAIALAVRGPAVTRRCM